MTASTLSRATYLSSADVKPLAQRSNLWGALLVGHCYGVVVGAIAIYAAWPNPLTFILAVMLIGSRQLGFAILMHESAHRALFDNRKVNDWVGTWLCGRPILTDMEAYRQYHLPHHKYTQTERDPDLVLSKPFPTTRGSLKRKFWRDLSGQTGAKLRISQLKQALRKFGDKAASERSSQAFNGPQVGAALAVNAVLALVMGLVGEWWWWLAFWLLPLLTWFQFVVRLRNIAEHGVVERSNNPLRNVRTTMANPLIAHFVAPYWVNYHLEHHLAMHVPCRNLPKLHELLLRRGHGDDMMIGSSYWQVLKTASSRPA
ncbi:MAG: fatty acid desaturase family protein [Gammaproteobacteria bacterium]|nr:fatty acid desaturase family protein [Gammaproteobacteria bacterium]